MEPLYRQDLAYIQATAFGTLARGAAPEIVAMLRRAPVEVRRVVDAGCGAGPLSAALVEAGFAVVGMDTSADLLAIARAAVPAARFLRQSIYAAPVPACEAIVALGEPLTYHPEGADADARVEGFFQTASAVLPAGGMPIFDVIEPGEPSLAGRYCSSGEDWAVLSDTGEDQGARTLVRRIETFRRTGDLYPRGREVHHVRLFHAAALCDQLTRCGFSTRTAQAYGAHILAPRRRAFFCTRRP